MKRKHLPLILSLLFVLALCAACASETPAEEPAAPEEPDAGPALTLSGMVDAEMAWTEADLQAMQSMNTNYTDKDGVTSTFSGVPVKALLELAGVQDGAAELVFVADDGFEGAAVLEEVLACVNCIVAFDDGGLRMVMPEFSGKAQVKGVVEIKVQ